MRKLEDAGWISSRILFLGNKVLFQKKKMKLLVILFLVRVYHLVPICKYNKLFISHWICYNFPQLKNQYFHYWKTSFYRQKFVFPLLERSVFITVKPFSNKLCLNQWKYYCFPYGKYQFPLVEKCFHQCEKYGYIK